MLSFADEAGDAAESVRFYTEHLALQQSPGSSSTTLQRFLIQDREIESNIRREREDWRRYYEPWRPSDLNSDLLTEVFRIEAKNLSRIWLEFRRSLPVDQRDDIEGQIPSVDGLIQMVNLYTSFREEEKAKSKRGKFMRHFSSVCSTIESHQVMLDVLPCGNEYVSLFTGALKTIVTACSNYDRISQGLAEALSRIGKHIHVCAKEASLFRTADMQVLLAKLYAHIFLFLEDVMKWYLKKSRSRFLDAFRGDFYDEFKSQIDGILEMSRGIKREADVGSKAEVRSVRLQADNIFDQLTQVSAELNDLRVGMEGSSRDLAEVRQIIKYTSQANKRHHQSQMQAKAELPDRIEFMNEIMSQIFATANAKKLLNSRGRVFIEERGRKQLNDLNIMQLNENWDDSFESSEAHSSLIQTFRRDDLELVCEHLEDYFDRSQILPEGQSNQDISLDNSIASDIQKWMAAPNSSIISLAGYVAYWPRTSQATMLSAMFIESGFKAQLPVISYFCELKRGQKIREGNTRESQELLALVSALIRQLIPFIAPQFESDRDLISRKFETLDGAMNTWAIALDLLQDLLHLSPPRLYCIIDGFQCLDDKSTRNALKELVEVLRGKNLADGHVLKVLITTQGRSACLEKELDRGAILYADQERSGSGVKRRMGGSRFTASIT